MRIKITILSLLLLLGIFLINASPIQAQETDRYIYSLTPYFEIADNVDIRNAINSDAILIATNVTVNAPVNGDLYVLGETVEINAKIDGSLRIISSKTTISSLISGSLSFISNDLEIKPTGEIEKDAYGFAENLKHDGRIGKDLNMAFNPEIKAELNGKIIGNVYHTKGIFNGAKSLIQGSIVEINEQSTKRNNRTEALISNIFQSLSLILIYILIRFLRPDLFNKLLQKANIEYLKLSLKGLLTFILVPLIIGLFAISIIGLPLALIIFCIGLFSIYISPIFAALIISKQIFKENAHKLLPIFISVLLLNLIYIAPIIGVMAIVLSILLTLGILIEYIFDKRYE